MAFSQFMLDKGINQTRQIFDTYIYRNDQDTIDQIALAGYFSESRFKKDPDWVGGIVQVQGIDGYAIIRILGNDETEVLLRSSVQLTSDEADWVTASTTSLQFGEVITNDNSYTEIGRFEIQPNIGVKAEISLDAKRLDTDGYFSGRYAILVFRNGAPQIVQGLETVYQKTSENGMDFRAQIDGNDLVFEVRGRNSQDWDWDLIVFFVEV